MVLRYRLMSCTMAKMDFLALSLSLSVSFDDPDLGYLAVAPHASNAP